MTPSFGGRPWFRQHRYGFGATPITGAGWLSTLLFTVLAVADARWAPPRWKGPGEAALIALLVALAWGKTEGGLRWRWDGDLDR